MTKQIQVNQMMVKTPEFGVLLDTIKKKGYKIQTVVNTAIREAIAQEMEIPQEKLAEGGKLTSVQLDVDLVNWLDHNTKPMGVKSAYMRKATTQWAERNGIN